MEGPSIVILSEELEAFLGKKVLSVSGNTKEEKDELKDRTLSQIDTWGKVLFLTFTQKNRSPIVTKTHFMMFGSYRINDPRENRIPRIELNFKNGTVYFYSCSFKFGAEKILESIDRRVDVLSPDWDEDHVVKLLKNQKNRYLCDLFLDQSIFAGAGNIIKNEALFNIRRHPLTKLGDVSQKDWAKLVWAIHEYCFNFYFWKKAFQLRRHWQVYSKKNCPICETKLLKEYTGEGKRRTFFCPVCQNIKQKSKPVTLYDVLPIEESHEKEERLDH